jgi:hypothetical protein
MLAALDLHVVLPRAGPDAFERVGIGRPLDGAGTHLDLVDLVVREVLPGVREPHRRIQAWESRQGGGDAVDVLSPGYQDVDVTCVQLDAL